MTLSLETKGNKLPQAFTTSTSLTSLTKATYDTNTGSDHSSNLKLSVLFKATVWMKQPFGILNLQSFSYQPKSSAIKAEPHLHKL